MKKNIVRFVLSVFVFISAISIATTVLALTSNNVNDLLNSGIITQAEADMLNNILNASTSPTDIVSNNQSTCVNLQNNMYYGLRDASVNGEVSVLQDFLQSNNYLSNNPTGFYGLMTTSAVKAFQSANSISPVGNVGPITRAEIASLTCENGTSQVSTSSNQSCIPLGGSLGALYPGNNVQCCAGLVQQRADANKLGSRGTCVKQISIIAPIITSSNVRWEDGNVTVYGSNFSGTGDKGIFANLFNINDPYGVNYGSSATKLNNNVINFKLRENLPQGTYNLSVNDDGGQSNSITFVIGTGNQNTALIPQIYSITSPDQPFSIGDKINISGANFTGCDSVCASSNYNAQTIKVNLVDNNNNIYPNFASNVILADSNHLSFTIGNVVRAGTSYGIVISALNGQSRSVPFLINSDVIPTPNTCINNAICGQNSGNLQISLSTISKNIETITQNRNFVDLGHFDFFNNSKTQTAVYSLTIQIPSIIQLSNVHVYTGNGASILGISENSVVSPSSQTITFNNSEEGLFTVGPNTVTSISIRGDLPTNTNGQFSISLTGAAASIPIIAAYPISGTTISLSNPQILAPIINSINPTFGSSGTMVTLNGSNFFGTGDKGISVNLLNINDPYGTNYSSPVTLINSNMLSFAVRNDVPAGTYNLSVSADGGQSNTVNFYVNTQNVSTTTQTLIIPSITITSPNGGETWTLGNTYNLQFSSDKAYVEPVSNTGYGVGIALIRKGMESGPYCILAQGVAVVAGTNSFSVDLNKPCLNGGNLTAGNYKATVYHQTGYNLDINATSNNYFIISTTTTASLTPNSNVATALESLSTKDLIQIVKVLTGQK